MKLGLPDQTGFLNLLKRLQGSGYASDDGSVRVAELTGVAKIAALASEALDAVIKNMFVSHAVESLDDHDRLRQMPADSLLSTAERQARLVAFTRALPKLIEPRLDNAMKRWLGVSTGSTLASSAAAARGHACSHWGGLVVSRYEPSAQLVQLRTIDAIMTRGLPARALSRRGANHYADFSVDVEGAAFRVNAASYTPNAGPSIVAPFEQFPGSVVDLATFREMQSMLFWKCSRGGSNSLSGEFTTVNDQVTYPAETLFCAGSIAPGATATLDVAGGFGWDERVVQGWIAVSASSFTDSTAAGVEHGWLGPSKLGTSPGTAFTHSFIGGTLCNGLDITITAGGDLTLTNTSGTDTTYFKLYLRKTARVLPGVAPIPEPYVDTPQFIQNTIHAMHYAARVRSPSNASYKALVVPGDCVRRVLYTGPMKRPNASGANPSVVTLDTSIDWRNRALLVSPVTGGSDTAVQWAGANVIAPQLASDTGGSTVALSRVLMTNGGAASTAGSVAANQMACSAYAPVSIWIYADSTTGHLMAEMKDASTNIHAHGFILVLASSTVGTPSGAAAEELCIADPQVYPVDLNRPQNLGCFAQGQSTSLARVTCPPLGSILEGGLPARPLSWLVRERLGSIQERTLEVRQSIYGQRKRLLSIGIAPGATVEIDAFNSVPDPLDGTVDQMDYRDRLIVVEGTYQSPDISLARATQLSDAGSAHFAFVLYTGPYGDVSIDTDDGDLRIHFFFGRTGSGAIHSRMAIENLEISTRYVNLCVEASGFLGLTDRRLAGEVS